MASCTSSLLNRLQFMHLLNLQLNCVLHCWLLDTWHLYIVMWYHVDIPILTDVDSVPTYSGAGIWSWYKFQSSCKHHSWNFQEMSSKLHRTIERMYHGQFATRHAFARKKGQQLCGSVKWKQPARTAVNQPDFMLAKDFSKLRMELPKNNPKCSGIYLASAACTAMTLNLPDWVTGMFLKNDFWHSFVLCLANLLDLVDHWSWKCGRLALTF